MYNGYLELGGNEVINSARAYGYSNTAECPIGWLRCGPCDTLSDALGDGQYDISGITQAPWYDPLDESTTRFYGVSALSMENLSDSTRSASVQQGITDGGVVGTVRHAVRQIQVRAVLTAKGEDALEAGLSWLDAALQPELCSSHGNSCGAADACFFVACPPERGTVTDFTDWTEARRNYIANPALVVPGVEGAAVNGWFQTTQQGGVARNSGSTIYSNHVNAVTGQQVGSRITIQSNVNTTGTVTLWQTVGGSISGQPAVASQAVTLVAGVPQQISLGGTLAGTTDGVRLGVTGLTIAGSLQIVRAIVELGTTTAGPYFDGDSPDTNLAQFSWAGVENNSSSVYESRAEYNRPEDDVEYGEVIRRLDRRLHGVTCISGPLVEQKLVRGDSYGYIVNFVLAAATPWVFSETREVNLETVETSVIQDVPFNLVRAPSAEFTAPEYAQVAQNLSANPSLESNVTGWSGAASTISGTSPAAYFTNGRVTGEPAANGTASYRARILGNLSTTVTGARARMRIQQTVTLNTHPWWIAGRTRVSVNIWGAIIITTGTSASSIQAMYSEIEWLNGASAVIGTTNVATAPPGNYGGYPFIMKSILPPSGTVSARVSVVGEVTWGSSSTGNLNSDIRMYADALALTIP